MDTTNLQTGVSGKTMLLDFVEEVQVKSSGYNAEFGGATGGVVNVLTKSGSNAFHGQAGTYYQTDDMYGKSGRRRAFNPIDSNLAETGMITPDNGWTYYSPVADIGGPLLRDRLWFYGGAAYTKNENANDVTFRTDVSKTKRHFESWDDAKYYNYNVTRQLTNNLRVKFAGSNQRNASRGTLPVLQPDNARDPRAELRVSEWRAERRDVAEHVRRQSGRLDSTRQRSTTAGSTRVDNRRERHLLGQRRLDRQAELLREHHRRVYRKNRTTPAEFRGDADPPHLRQLQHRFGHDRRRLPDGADAVPAADGF